MALLLFIHSEYFKHYKHSKFILSNLIPFYMKKIAFILLLSFVSISFTSCVNNDDDYYLPVENTGSINYRGLRTPLRHVVILERGLDSYGYYNYDLFASENYYPMRGEGHTKALLYMEISSRRGLTFSGIYKLGSNFDRNIDRISYYENVTMYNGAIDQYQFKLNDDQVANGDARITLYTSGLLDLDFFFTDIERSTLQGKYRGDYYRY